MKNNFYMVLPSNSAPIIHPENTASKFIIDWRNPMYLTGNWEVALHDYSFIFSPFPMYSNCKINYVYQTTTKELKIRCRLVEGIEPKVPTTEIKGLEPDIISKVIIVKSHQVPYTIEFDNIEDAQLVGLNALSNTFYENVTILTYNDNFVKLRSSQNIGSTPGSCDMVIWYHTLEKDVMTFGSDVIFQTAGDFAAYIHNFGIRIFMYFTILDDNKFKFKLQANVKTVTFDHLLTKTLGLSKQLYTNQSNLLFTSDKELKLVKEYQQMYIYANIIEPIIVGDNYAPLLKVIWLQKAKDGTVMSASVQNLMYLPVSSNCINNIEFNVRDDLGDFIKFPKYLNTNITLHFRKINEQS